jgi:hypothetical protein
MNYVHKLRIKITNIFKRVTSTDLDFFEEQFRYGHREILLSYARLQNSQIDENAILDGSIDHGWAPHENKWILRKKNLRFANRYVWNEKRLENYSKKNRAVAVGAPWLYLLASLEISKENVEEKLKKTKNKVVLIPGHSNLSDCNHKILSQVLSMQKSIPSNSNVTVSLYWVDYLNVSLREEIEELGFKVFCAGFVPVVPYQDTEVAGRPSFLLELFDLLSDAELVVVSELSTAGFYAMSLGAKICFAPPPNTPWPINSKAGQTPLSEPKSNIQFFQNTSEWINSKFPIFYSTHELPKSFVEFAWDELGEKSFIKNPHGLKFVWKTAKVRTESLRIYETRILEIKLKIKEQSVSNKQK